MTTICVYCGGNVASGCGPIEREGGRYEHYSKIDCAEVLKKQVTEYRKMLWVLARRGDRLALHISKKDLDTVPEEAELLSWYEPLFGEVLLKGICSPINQPDLAKPVNDTSKTEKRNDEGADKVPSGGYFCFRCKTTVFENVPCPKCGL